MNQNNNASVLLVIYKEILMGDFKKFQASSNQAQTGGGARDLRFSPFNDFYNKFKIMFPNVQADGTLMGKFSWAGVPDTDAKISRATNARPNELRIMSVDKNFPSQYIPANNNDCILLFVLDTSGKVYPYFTSMQNLLSNNWHNSVKDPIVYAMTHRHSQSNAVRGYIDFMASEEKHYG